MDRNLLFISKYPDNIKEFLNAMGEKDIAIDTADNGYDAAMLLKKKEYQIVVTGLVLDGFNGEQIITYINKVQPNTVCIIYTTTISAAQLHFFINKRDVFRVFLRPVNFRMEFMQALEEAFEYYAIRLKDQQEELERKKQFKDYQKNIAELEARLERQKRVKVSMNRYMKKVVSFSINEYAGRLSGEGRKRLENFEHGVVGLCCGEREDMEGNLSKAEMGVRHIQELAGK